MSEEFAKRKKNLNDDQKQALPSFKFKDLKTFLIEFYVLPDSPFLKGWQWLMVTFNTINAMMLPLQAAFFWHSPWNMILDYSIDVFFLIDLYFKAHTAFLSNGFLVVFPKDMALNYVRNTFEFAIDVIGNIPFDFIALAYPPAEQLRVLTLLRLIRLVRCIRIPIWFFKEESRLNAPNSLQVIKFILYIGVMMHWAACVWYAMACPGAICLADSWAQDSGGIVNGETSYVSQYTRSLYFVVMTMTTTGYGDIHAQNDSERVFSIIVMNFGYFLYAYVSGTIASTLANMNSRRVAYRQKLDAIKQFMVDQSMENDLQKRISDFYEYSWERNKGIDVKNVFSDLPTTFRQEVALSITKSIIQRVPMFANTDLGFIRILASFMRLHIYTANEYITHKDDVATEMYFIVHGRVDVLASDSNDKKPVTSLVDGSFYGEISLVLSKPHLNSTLAITHCDIFVLGKAELEEAFSAYPHIRKKVIDWCEEKHRIQQEEETKRLNKIKRQTMMNSMLSEEDLEEEKKIKASQDYDADRAYAHSIRERRASNTAGKSLFAAAPPADLDHMRRKSIADINNSRFLQPGASPATGRRKSISSQAPYRTETDPGNKSASSVRAKSSLTAPISKSSVAASSIGNNADSKYSLDRNTTKPSPAVSIIISGEQDAKREEPRLDAFKTNSSSDSSQASSPAIELNNNRIVYEDNEKQAVVVDTPQLEIYDQQQPKTHLQSLKEETPQVEEDAESGHEIDVVEETVEQKVISNHNLMKSSRSQKLKAMAEDEIEEEKEKLVFNTSSLDRDKPRKEKEKNKEMLKKSSWSLMDHKMSDNSLWDDTLNE